MVRFSLRYCSKDASPSYTQEMGVGLNGMRVGWVDERRLALLQGENGGAGWGEERVQLCRFSKHDKPAMRAAYCSVSLLEGRLAFLVEIMGA